MPGGDELNCWLPRELRSTSARCGAQCRKPSCFKGLQTYKPTTSALHLGWAPLANLSLSAAGSVLLAVALQLDHLVLDFQLFLLQPADLEIIGARSGHLFLDPRLQYAVLLGKLREMSGKRHIALRLGVERTSSVTRT